MNTNDLDTSVSLRDDGLTPGENQTTTDADWNSWIDPNDTRDSLRIDRVETPRSALHVIEALPRSASSQQKGLGARLGLSETEMAAENAKLRARVRDLSRENDRMNDMIEGTGVATVFLDRELRVVRFTPAAKEIGYDRMDEVVENARSVLDTLRPKQTEIQSSDGRWFRMYAHPYRTLNATVEGVVITFIDITEQRGAQQEVTRQLAAKETLLKEVHHRVRNNTASIAGLLSIQAQSIVDSEAQSVLRGAIARVESMSVLYDKLLVSEQYGASSVQDYLEDLADGVMALFPERPSIVLEKHIANFNLKSDDLFPLGLITNELLTNVMKHAFDGRASGLITLTFERTGKRVSLIVQDDGVGLPPGFDPTAATGFGLTLVRMLSEQLRGSFSVSNRKGTRSALEFVL